MFLDGGNLSTECEISNDGDGPLKLAYSSLVFISTGQVVSLFTN